MQHLDTLFLSLTLILLVAGVTTLLFKFLKQPPVLGYIVAGFLTGPNFHFFPTVLDQNSISVWGDVGVVFLLFAVGLEFNIKKIKKVGATGAITATVEALVMSAVGFIAGRLMGWSIMNSVFLGGMISISSTSIVVKAFDDLKLKYKQFSRIVLGVLVFEDLIAILLIVALSSIAISNQFDGMDMLFELGKLLLFLTLWFTGGIFLVPSLFRRLKRYMNDETLLILSIGMCLGAVVMAVKVGFSPALGAFLMGTIMAETDESENIRRLITPIKTLFTSVFFISVGMLVNPYIVHKYIGTITIITILVLVIKPIAATIGVILSGNPVKRSMQAGFSLSQIGEFSFIIAALGLSLNVIDDYVYPVIVAVSIITTFITPYSIKIAEPLYNLLYRMAPHRWKLTMSQYGFGSFMLNREGEWQKLLRAYFLRIVIQSAWISSIIWLFFNALTPFAYEMFGSDLWVDIIIAIVILAAIAPFLYALMIKNISIETYERLWMDRKYARGPLITLRLSRIIIGSIFIGAVLGKIFAVSFALFIPFIVLIIFVLRYSRTLRNYYTNIEQQFFSNLDKTKKQSGIIIPRSISKDIHMEYVDIPIYSDYSGLTIREIHRKYRTGARVISIQRKNSKISLPNNDQMLLAGDRVLIIGDDTQIELFKGCVEQAVTAPNFNEASSDLNLYKITISESSVLCGEKTHTSLLLNKYDFLMIGYEGIDGRFRRLDNTHIIVSGDTIWAVGNKDKLMVIM